MKYLLVLLVSLLFVSYQLKSSPGEQLTICFEEHSEPYSYLEDDLPAGFDIDIAKALAEQMQMELSVKWLDPSTSKRFIGKSAILEAGQCDAIAGYPMHARMLGSGPESANASSSGSRLLSSQPYSVRAHTFRFAEEMSSAEVNVGFAVQDQNYLLLKKINIALSELSRNQKIEQLEGEHSLASLPTSYPPLTR